MMVIHSKALFDIMEQGLGLVCGNHVSVYLLREVSISSLTRTSWRGNIAALWRWIHPVRVKILPIPSDPY